MSAEESERKPIPQGLEKALRKLAKKTVEEGWDPGQVAMGLYRMLKALSELSPTDRAALRHELRIMCEQEAGNKPRSVRDWR